MEKVRTPNIEFEIWFNGGEDDLGVAAKAFAAAMHDKLGPQGITIHLTHMFDMGARDGDYGQNWKIDFYDFWERTNEAEVLAILDSFIVEGIEVMVKCQTETTYQKAKG